MNKLWKTGSKQHEQRVLPVGRFSLSPAEGREIFFVERACENSLPIPPLISHKYCGKASFFPFRFRG